VHGTYPHDQWQGTRVEGFVVSQGPPIDPAFAENIAEVAAALEGQSMNITDFDPETVQAASRVLVNVGTNETIADKLMAEVPQLAQLLVRSALEEVPQGL
jgi:hypothetical protein